MPGEVGNPMGQEQKGHRRAGSGCHPLLKGSFCCSAELPVPCEELKLCYRVSLCLSESTEKEAELTSFGFPFIYFFIFIFSEPNNYRTLIGRSVNGSQLGKDYTQLRSLLQLIRTYSRAHLYGPNIGRPRKNVIAFLEG